MPAAKGRVLLTDDEPNLLECYRRILKSAGYEVETADDGATGIAAFRRSKFDVVITDLAMPGMSGLDMMRAIHELDEEAPVVVMTGGPSLDTALSAIEQGVLRYLTKPFPAETLLSSVSCAIESRKKGAATALAHQRENDVLSQALDRALSQLYMAFQPIVVWGERSVRGYEALLRSRESALPHPGAIIAAAEKLGRCHDLGQRVRAAVAEAAASLPPDADIYVNVHPSDLTDPMLYDRQAPLSLISSRVVLEITEQASLHELRDIAACAKSLRSMGYRLALDDLGAGYAALSSMSVLEPQVVKVDMALVRDVNASPTKQKIIASIIHLCHSLEIQVVAEGIESAAERDALATLGVDMMQGYLFAKPASPPPEVRW